MKKRANLLATGLMLFSLISTYQVGINPAIVNAASCVTSGTPGTEDVTGQVFRDYNVNGVEDAGETDAYIPSSVTITAFWSGGDCDVSPMPDGTYTLTVPTGSDVRVEVSNLPSYMAPSAHGSGSSSLVQFVSSPATNVDFAIANPSDYCQDNPDLATPCYVFGDQSGTDDVLVRFGYLSGDESPNETTPDIDNLLNKDMLPANELGSVFGVAYHRQSDSLFSAAFMKRHSGFGPDGQGAIYITDYSGPSPVTSLFLDLADAPYSLSVGSDPHPATDADNTPCGGAPASGNSCYYHDPNSFAEVGKISLGDLDMSEDGQTIYVTNLATNELVEIAVGDTPTAPGSVNTYAIPEHADCLTGTADTTRSGGLGIKDGKVYVGTVCSADSSQDINKLDGYVYEFDPLTSLFNTTPVLSMPFDWPKGCLAQSKPPVTCNGQRDNDWMPWDDNPLHGTHILDLRHYPQPWITDIDFDNGNMLLGIRDRNADQVANAGLPGDLTDGQIVQGVSGGDILRACGDPETGWTLEDNGTCGSITTSGAGVGNGPGTSTNGEYYTGDDHWRHLETSTGTLVQIPGQPDVVTTVFDPWNDVGGGGQQYMDQGIAHYSNSTGEKTRSIRIYDGTTSSTTEWGKAAGLGDLAAFCDASPIEIGNRLWSDTDGDGVQDPDELPISGVSVQLIDTDGTTVLGIAVTDADGYYYFSSAMGTDTASEIYSMPLLTNQTGYKVRVDMSQSAITTPGYLLTVADNDPSSNGDARDSDGVTSGMYAETMFNTLGAGQNDHSYDFGFTTGKSRIGNVVWYDADNDGIYEVGETPIEGVTVELYADIDTDGIFEPGGDDGTALLSQVTGSGAVAGKYWFENLGDGEYFVVIPTVGNDNVTIGATTGVDLADLFNSNSSGLTNHTLSSYEPIDDDVDNDDNGLDDGNIAIPAGFETISKVITLSAGTEGLNEAGPGQVAGADETEANAQPGSGMPADNESNLHIDFGFYELPDISIDKLAEGSDVDSVFTDTEEIDIPPALGATSFQYQIEATNQADLVDGTAVQVTDNVPEGITIVSVDSVTHGSVTTGLPVTSVSPFGTTTILWDIGTLTPGTTATLVLNAELDDADVATFIANADPTTGLNQNVVQVTAMTEDDTDSTVNSHTVTDPSTFDAGTSEDDEDDAFVYIPPALGDYVWVDLNGDGDQDGGETGLNGVTVNLYIDDDLMPGPSPGDTLEQTTVTASNGPFDGFYLFAGLSDGVDYYVEFDHSTASGYSPTLQDVGDDNLDSDGDPTTGYATNGGAFYNLAPGEFNISVDQGYIPFFSLGNRVWLDDGSGGGTINDGMQNGSEPGINGLTVRLLDNLGTPVDDPNQPGVQDYVVTTDANGYYRFDTLVAGDYIVQVDDFSIGISSSTGQTVTYTDDQKDHGADTQVAGNWQSEIVSLGLELQPTSETDIGTGQGAEGTSGNAGSNLAVDFGFVYVSDITVSKDVSPSSYTLGTTTSITYTVVVTNKGPAELTNATVVDSAPADVTFNSWTCSITNSGTPGDVTNACGAGSGTGNISSTVTLAVGAEATYTINAEVSDTATATRTNTVTVGLPSGILQDPITNDPDSDTADVSPLNQTPSIQVDKTSYEGHDAGASCGGVDLLTIVDPDANPHDVTFCFEVTNDGNTYLDYLTMDDPLFGIDENDWQPYSGTFPLTPAGSAMFYYETTVSSGLINSVTVSATPTVSDSTPTGQADVSDTDPSATVVYIFDPPFGIKTGTVDGNTIINWNMVWINDSTVTASNVEITDEVPEDTTYAGNLQCIAEGATVVHSCGFEAPSGTYPRGRVIVTADMAPDPGATDEDDAANELVISFDVSIDDPTIEEYENQGVLSWDADMDMIPDFIVPTDDPAPAGASDPTVLNITQLSETGSPAMLMLLVGPILMVAPAALAILKGREKRTN